MTAQEVVNASSKDELTVIIEQAWERLDEDFTNEDVGFAFYKGLAVRVNEKISRIIQAELFRNPK